MHGHATGLPVWVRMGEGGTVWRKERSNGMCVPDPALCSRSGEPWCRGAQSRMLRAPAKYRYIHPWRSTAGQANCARMVQILEGARRHLRQHAFHGEPRCAMPCKPMQWDYRTVCDLRSCGCARAAQRSEWNPVGMTSPAAHN